MVFARNCFFLVGMSTTLLIYSILLPIFRLCSGTSTTVDPDIGSVKSLNEVKLEGRESNSQGYDDIQKPAHLLEVIAGHLNNDRPIKLDILHRLTVSLKQHFKFKAENSGSKQKKLMSDESISNLVSIVHNVIGKNSDTMEYDQNSSLHSNLSSKDQDLIILSGKSIVHISP